LETVVLKHGWATSAELESTKPGGPDNKDSGPRGWLRYFGTLHRHHSKGERLDGATSGLSADADATILKVLRSESHPVERIMPGDDHRPAYLHVYPKSFRSLVEISKIDYTLAWLTSKLGGWTESGKSDDVALMNRALDEIRYQYELLTWIMTTKGRGLPYDPDDERPEIPKHIAALDVMDMYRVAQAYSIVHVTRLEALKHLTHEVDPQGKRTRPSWSIFLDLASTSLEVELPRLMSDWDLPMVVAKAQLSASNRESAKQQAKAEKV
jgi:hypothetical protein